MSISKIFRILQIACCVLCGIGLLLLLWQKVDNAGLCIISMVFSILFGMLYKESIKKDN